jgi:Ca-activated chloride channel family protein
MNRRLTYSLTITLAMFALSYFALPKQFNLGLTNTVSAAPGPVTQGTLQARDSTGAARGECPLKHTGVQAHLSGSLARVTVTQEFHNPFPDKIEAVYVFPLPQNAAVDDMTMQIGARTIKGKIKQREEARAIYETARAAGQLASLLDQERPNIFTQAVANIAPGAVVKVTISYVEYLKYEDGNYEFVFPMVVGPRYIPGPPLSQPNSNTAPDTSEVPDAARITPPLTPAGTRAGHDISITVNAEMGVPLETINSTQHEIAVERPAAQRAIVRLQNQATIPNKDFVLKFDVAGKQIQDALLAHRGMAGGFFALMLQPPERVTYRDVAPKELVFVLDTSGSMSGFPIEKAKETMKLALDGLYPQDTFNLITFAGDTHILFPQPVPATPANLAKAQAFLESRAGGGGTEMMTAIRAALEPSDKQDHLRIVCFMTDGYIGNDFAVIGEVRKHPNARVFSFGIGSSVNRFLLDKMAEEGRGEVEYVALNDDGSAAARRFHERIRNPLLTDIELDWNGLPVSDVYPQRIPDLFGAKPLILTGRYTRGVQGVLRLRGKLAGQPFQRELTVNLPEAQPQNEVLATLWARTRIDQLMSEDFQGLQNGNPKPEVRDTITQLGLDFRLLTQFTSFVAVEETIVTEGGQPRRVEVPVELPEGVSREGLFGQNKDKKFERLELMAKLSRPPQVAYKSLSVAGAALRETIVSNGSGSGAGVGSTAPPPPSPEPLKPTSSQPKNPLHNAKLHPAIAALLVRLQTNATPPAPVEAKFIRAGKATVQLRLSSKSAAVLDELKRLGFEVVSNPATPDLLIGRIEVEKLAALAELASVRYIAPQLR